ncbi:MAG: zf-HC2 domain-containing protein [Candidatus Krumholzibacteriia bacterium]
MKCSRIQEWISQEMDDQLPPEHVASLAEHLQACAECREFRSDLQFGVRMLRATEPTLGDDFDWKLQLRLSRAMREAAQGAYPWQESPPRWRPWLSRVGVSAAVGLAAVLTVAVLSPGALMVALTAPAVVAGDPALRMPVSASAGAVGRDATRRPLQVDFGGGTPFGGLQRSVSSRNEFTSEVLDRVSEPEVMRIRRLEQDNETMRRRLFAKDRQIQYLQAQLDSLTGQAVDRN